MRKARRAFFEPCPTQEHQGRLQLRNSLWVSALAFRWHVEFIMAHSTSLARSRKWGDAQHGLQQGVILGCIPACPCSPLTLTSLSQPQETMMGLLLLGENRTHDTHSEWLSSYKEEHRDVGNNRAPTIPTPCQHLHTTSRLASIKQNRETSLTCTVYLHTPNVFQSLMVLSLEPETICRLSEEKATLSTSLVWPTKRRVVVPLRMQSRSLKRQVRSF